MNGGEGEVKTLDFHNMKVISAVGRGAKGVVFLARIYGASNGEWLALKLISKELLQKKNKNRTGECKRIRFEQQILRRFDHPLLPHLKAVLETDKLHGFAIDYCHGGNLHSLRKKQPKLKFSEETIRFYAVELVLALEYLHKYFRVVYRDLKPENIMIQQTGHIMLVDFDLSKKLNPKSPNSLSCNSSPDSLSSINKDRRKGLFSRFNCYCHSGIVKYESETETHFNANSMLRRSESDSVEKSNSFVGTEDYVAPEVIKGGGHNFAVDWWSLGIVLYELLYGTTPFKGSNRKETFCKILGKEPDLTGEMTPLKNLIKKLLEKDPDRRIEIDGITNHEFFKNVKWDKVLRIARPPYIPENEVVDKTSGFSKKDVESFVHGVFFPKNNDVEKEKNNGEMKKKDGNEINDKSNKNVWVQKLNQNHAKEQNFLVF